MRFCSNTCYEASPSYSPRREIRKIDCVWCGVEFHTKIVGRKYCNRTCFLSAKVHVTSRELRLCPWCKCEIPKDGGSRIHCSMVCWRVSATFRRITRECVPGFRNCWNCSRRFIAPISRLPKPRARFCSESCRPERVVVARREERVRHEGRLRKVDSDVLCEFCCQPLTRYQLRPRGESGTRRFCSHDCYAGSLIKAANTNKEMAIWLVQGRRDLNKFRKLLKNRGASRSLSKESRQPRTSPA